MLEIKDLTIQYGEKDAVVENFSLTMKKGEVISLSLIHIYGKHSTHY